LSHILDIRVYGFRRDDRLFPDANVWLSVSGPLAKQDWRTAVYSAALRNMRSAGAQIFLDVLVLSEFINGFARLEYQQLPPEERPPDFKTFRRSELFEPVANDIATNARRILARTTRCDSLFESIDVVALIAEYQVGDSDFNDQMIREICKAKEFTLVTHDADFRTSGIRILTANRHLLA
jgi:predicted nucleic acid-binding protein